MTTLHLGVVELPYATKEGASTGDVAEWLERKYGIMAAFYRRHGQQVADSMTHALAGQLENLMMGAPASSNPYAGGESKTKAAFDQFLTSGEIESMGIPGVPTKAAQGRRSLRFKSKKAQAARPSFVDTGLYDRSFKAWVD
jgi:hypothetical protein